MSALPEQQVASSCNAKAGIHPQHEVIDLAPGMCIYALPVSEGPWLAQPWAQGVRPCTSPWHAFQLQLTSSPSNMQEIGVLGGCGNQGNRAHM